MPTFRSRWHRWALGLLLGLAGLALALFWALSSCWVCGVWPF